MRETKMRVSCAFFNAHSKQRTHTYTNTEMNTNALLSLSLLEMCLYGASKKTRSYFSKKNRTKKEERQVSLMKILWKLQTTENRQIDRQTEINE
jgi:hypothetical protein